MNNKGSKDISIELMRIFACFFVIFNHTGQNGFLLFSLRNIGWVQYWIDLFISIFCKFSVPMFFAISGALLLPKRNESIREIYIKRVLRMISTLILFSFLYYMVEVLKGNEEFKLSWFFLKTYYSSWNGTFWYLYAYIPFLMTLPLLRALDKDMKIKEYIYLFAVGLFFHWILPVIQYFCGGKYAINDYFVNNIRWIFINIVEYPLLGSLLYNKIEILKIEKKKVAILWFVNIFLIICSCYLTFYKQSKGEGIDQAFHNTFVIVNTATLFITFKLLFERIRFNKTMYYLICSLGECTFGIYLFHALILMKWEWFSGIWDLLHGIGINYMVVAFLVCFIVMIIGYIITYVLKKVPIINRLL